MSATLTLYFSTYWFYTVSFYCWGGMEAGVKNHQQINKILKSDIDLGLLKIQTRKSNLVSCRAMSYPKHQLHYELISLWSNLVEFLQIVWFTQPPRLYQVQVSCVLGDCNNEFMKSSINLSLMGMKATQQPWSSVYTADESRPGSYMWHARSRTTPEYRGGSF